MTTIREVSNLLGVSRQSIEATYLPKLDPSDIDRSHKPMRVRFAAVVQVLVEREVSERMRGLPSPDDPMMSAADSPALERYRLAKAEHAELDLEVRRGTMIEVEPAKEYLSRWSMHIRSMGEKLQKLYGNDASIIVNDTLTECRASVRDVFNIDDRPEGGREAKK